MSPSVAASTNRQRLSFRRSSRRGMGGRKSGQAMIEMAIVMSLLLILTFGMVDFGLFLTGYIRASNCAREVTRTAVVRVAGAESKCGSHQLTPLFESYSVALDPADYMNASTGTPVKATVVATYRWKAIAPLMNAFYPGGTIWDPTITTTTTATMRMEGKKP